MVFILGGNTQIGAQVKSDIGNLNCLRQSQILFLFQDGPVFLHTCAPCYELPSDVSAVVQYDFIK